MASDQANGPAPDHPRDELQPPAPVTDAAQPGSGRQTPESLHRLHTNNSNQSNQSSLPPASQWPDEPPRRSGERNRSRHRSGRSGSGQVRICKKCGEQLTGQFVRALDGTFHLDCFKCRDCGEIVASKFFPADDNDGNGQYPLCETDYFRRLGLLCHKCGGALRGSYITALDRKYHVDHFSCCMCSTVFGAQDSYYEHDGDVYCHFHYSTRFAQRCNGCQTAILKQFVEIFRNGQNQHWHPECYMIHKFWNVRLGQSADDTDAPALADKQESKDLIREDEARMEDKVFRIWSVLSAFEESSAACISDMLLHVSNGSYLDGVVVAKRFIWHVEILFKSTDRLDQTVLAQNGKGLSYGREAKLLCKKIVAFFSLLSKTQEAEVRKLGVTQELLTLVTGLAHYLKLLIRICLQGALRLERESQTSAGLDRFLDDLNDFEAFKTDDGVLEAAMSDTTLSANDSDQCTLCRRAIEDECAKHGDARFHLACVGCTRCGRDLGTSLAETRFSTLDNKLYCAKCAPPQLETHQLEYVSKLEQFVFLLKVALARLLNILSNNGSGSTNDGSSVVDNQNLVTQPPRLTADSRSKSYSPAVAGETGNRRESTYENSLNEVRRLRSTRLDRHLSSSVRRARTSKVYDGDGRPRAGSPSGDSEAIQGSTDAMFGHNDAITLDDIPRIVAAEQSREKQDIQGGAQPVQDGPRHNRAFSLGKDADFRTPDAVPARITRKFFPELSALEYFNVRHLAVLTMHPLVENEFTLDELLGFIEARKPATFWKNLGKAFKNDKSKGNKKKGVFGVPLDVIIDRDGAESTDGVGPGALRVPAIVDDLITSMRQMDLSVEGVFRKNGNIKKQLDMVERINAEGCDSVNFMEQPVIQLAALLKRYLRELPDPLMTHKLYRLWTSAAKITDPAKRKQCLHLTCCLLPKSHRDCLEILFTFLKWAGSFHQLDEEVGSKMDVRNLATVIAPNILTDGDKAPTALDNNPLHVIDAVDVLIDNIEEMCQVPDELLTLLNDPYLFSGSGEITTKEILKRFQDRRGQVKITEVSEAYNRQDMSSRSPPKHIETDPALWQAERTVRPIHDPSASHGTTPPGPPGLWPQGEERPSPYKNSHYTNSEGNLSGSEHNQRGDWRNSAWGRHPGGLGVGNN